MNLPFRLHHIFTLIGTDVYNFLGATLRDATPAIHTSSQQTNVQRAIEDVKSIFCKINEDFCQFKFKFVHKVCVFSFFFAYFTYSGQCSNLVIGKLTLRSIRNRFRLFVEMKQISRKDQVRLIASDV